MTTNRPKVMLPIAGKPLLRWLVDSFKQQQINDITVVGGYRADAIDPSGIELVVNERYAETGELASLACAVDSLECDTVICYGDLLFKSYVLHALVESKADFSVIVDSSPTAASNRTARDFAYCSRPDDRGLFGTPVTLKRIVSHQHPNEQGQRIGAVADDAMGRWIGLLKVSRNGLTKLHAVMTRLRQQSDFDELDVPALLNALIADGAQIEVVYIHGHWRGVNDLEDLQHAVDFAYAQTPFGSTPEGKSSAADA
jgi:phosphoenolpyruvate phosphomutase